MKKASRSRPDGDLSSNRRARLTGQPLELRLDSAEELLLQMLPMAARRGTGRDLLIVDDRGRQTLGYDALWRRACAIAAQLQSLNLPGAAEVVLYLDDPLRLMAGFWGCVLAGKSALPLAPTPRSELEQPDARLATVLRLLKNPLLLTSAPEAEVSAACGRKDVPVFQMSEAATGTKVPERHRQRRDADGDATRPALLLPTATSRTAGPCGGESFRPR